MAQKCDRGQNKIQIGYRRSKKASNFKILLREEELFLLLYRNPHKNNVFQKAGQMYRGKKIFFCSFL